MTDELEELAKHARLEKKDDCFIISCDHFPTYIENLDAAVALLRKTTGYGGDIHKPKQLRKSFRNINFPDEGEESTRAMIMYALSDEKGIETPKRYNPRSRKPRTAGPSEASISYGW